MAISVSAGSSPGIEGMGVECHSSSYFVCECVAGVKVLEVKFRDEMVELAQATVVLISSSGYNCSR